MTKILVGIVIFAKNEYVQEHLSRQMANHSFQKWYQAILCGTLDKEPTFGTIYAPIRRKEDSILEREIHPDGKVAITHYKLIKNYTDYCFVEFKLETGRTHQIRVHSKHLGHPILGDTLYGTETGLIPRQALHAYKICFIHPMTNQKMDFEINLSEDIKKVLESQN